MTKRTIRIVLSVSAILIIVIAALLVLGYTVLTRTLNLSDYASFSNLPLYSWARVDLSDEAECSDGSDYDMYVRRGESENLIIYFAGGGACWNATTCSQPITLTNLSGFYFPVIYQILPNMLAGIFQGQDVANPFQGWNAVFIPYCTADLHIGAADPTYTLENNQTLTIRHRGQQNVTETLAWVFENFEQPPTLLIAGESAGGFGSVFWTPTIAAQYPDSDIYQLADGVYLETPLWNEIVTTVWQSDMLPVVGNDLAGDVYLSYAETSAPNVTYLHINTIHDSVLIYFDAYMNGATNDAIYVETWSQRMRASMQGISDSGLNYYFYLTDYGLNIETNLTPHTTLSGALFSEVEEDNVSLVEWLRRIVIEGERFSVGTAFLP